MTPLYVNVQGALKAYHLQLAALLLLECVRLRKILDEVEDELSMTDGVLKLPD